MIKTRGAQQDKRHHHYVPVAYLQHFTDVDKKIFAYRKHTKQREPLHTPPRSVGLINDYYAQPKPDGNTDYNTLENFLERLDAEWPRLVKRMEARECINDALEYMFEFIGAMRVRVPAARDAAEAIYRAGVKASMSLLERRGQLPPMPPGLTQKTIDIAINPHQSIHAMPQMARGFGIVVDMLGFEMLCNETDVPIITNDNPVMYFDADRPLKKIEPYRNTGKIELLMPISPKLALRGHPDLKPRYGSKGVEYRSIGSGAEINRINTLASMFGYDFVFAGSRRHGSVIMKFIDTAPILRARRISGGLHFETVFGPKPRKPKWKKEHEVPLTVPLPDAALD
jgi:Protein of unknown function (DUF4238)